MYNWAIIRPSKYCENVNIARTVSSVAIESIVSGVISVTLVLQV